MKITRTFNNDYYPNKSLILGNCYDVIINNQIYHHEFIITKNQALIIADSYDYLDEVIFEFRKDNSYITKFRTPDLTYYKAFDDVMTFKLPISIIQVSKPLINKDKLDQLDKEFNLNEIYLPVNIINDEYVLIDGHHRLYLAYLNHIKMVNVYINEYDNSINDFVYFAKEQNVNTIKSTKCIPNDMYDEIWTSFCKYYFNQ